MQLIQMYLEDFVDIFQINPSGISLPLEYRMRNVQAVGKAIILLCLNQTNSQLILMK